GCASAWATGLGSPATLWSSNEPGAGKARPPVPWLGDHAVRVDDVLAGRALVELLVALGGLVERDHGGVDVLGDLHLVMQDRHHQLPVVLHHRALAGGEGVGLGPAEPDPDRQRPDLGRLVDRARGAGHVQPGGAEPPGPPWRVGKEWDLAQPSPIRIDSDPTLAGSSTAPGSPVTYSPGMPSRPAARVMSMIEVHTVAGASPWEPSVPWPRASKPTQSTAASTSPEPPRICWSCSR